MKKLNYSNFWTIESDSTIDGRERGDSRTVYNRAAFTKLVGSNANVFIEAVSHCADSYIKSRALEGMWNRNTDEERKQILLEVPNYLESIQEYMRIFTEREAKIHDNFKIEFDVIAFLNAEPKV